MTPPRRDDMAGESVRRIAALHEGVSRNARPSTVSRPPRPLGSPTTGDVRRVDHAGYRSAPPLGVARSRDVARDLPSLAGSRRDQRADEGVEGNARLTGTTAAVLFVLFAAEGLTVLQIRSLLTAHVFIGMLLVPPILVKIGSTTWRFFRYYAGAPAYRRKGPPPPLLRMLGPVMVVLTVIMFASGIALLLGPTSVRSSMFFIHKASFVLWLLATAVHVLGHLLDTARLAPQDWAARTRRQVQGATARQWLVASSVAIGLVLGVIVAPKVGPWLAAGIVGVHHG